MTIYIRHWIEQAFPGPDEVWPEVAGKVLPDEIVALKRRISARLAHGDEWAWGQIVFEIEVVKPDDTKEYKWVHLPLAPDADRGFWRQPRELRESLLRMLDEMDIAPIEAVGV